MNDAGPTAEDINLANAIKTIELRSALGLPIFERWLVERCISEDVKPLWPKGVKGARNGRPA